MSGSRDEWNILIPDKESLDLYEEGDWWRIELANCNYYTVHHEHGRDLARNLIRYMRQHDDSHAIGRVMGSIFSRGFEGNEISVFDGFIEQIGEVVAKNQTGEIPQ